MFLAEGPQKKLNPALYVFNKYFCKVRSYINVYHSKINFLFEALATNKSHLKEKRSKLLLVTGVRDK